jgi:hypothetical protein
VKAHKTAAAALSALEDIRKRVKPRQGSPGILVMEESTGEHYKDVRIIDNVERGQVQILFRDMRPDNTGNVREVRGQRIMQEKRWTGLEIEPKEQ